MIYNTSFLWNDPNALHTLIAFLTDGKVWMGKLFNAKLGKKNDILPTQIKTYFTNF